MWLDTWVDPVRELYPHGSLNHFDTAFPPGFWSSLPGCQFVFGLSQGSHLCARAFLSQDGFCTKAQLNKPY